MKIIDISWPVEPQMTAYKDVNEVAFSYPATFEKNGYRKSTITISSHSGTHVDAPSHFHEAGKSIESISLQSLIGPCKILDLTHCSEKITAQDLKSFYIVPGDIILCKTKNSFRLPTEPFNINFIYIDLHAAQFLAEKKIKAIGIDYLGIERHQPGHETHSAFFNNNVTIIEGLRLAHVSSGDSFLCCLPLAIQGLEGAPARAVLIEH